MAEPLHALKTSSEHLRQIAAGIATGDLELPAYPSEWSVADVFSHLGSGAVIFRRHLEGILSGRAMPADFPQAVWDEWNAKAPESKRTDALAADQELVTRLDSLSDQERSDFEFVMGPITEDFVGFVCLRLNEHALHTWDIEVTLDPATTLSSEATECIIDRLELIVRHTGRPRHTAGQLSVRTTDPRREFSLTIGPESVSLAPSGAVSTPELELPAESFIRLVYGRLDSEHTPAMEGRDHLDTLRQVFQGP